MKEFGPLQEKSEMDSTVWKVMFYKKIQEEILEQNKAEIVI